MSRRGGKMYSILDKNAIISKYGENNIGIPLFECSNQTICQIYYFRWQVFCKHLKQTPRGWVVTEFLPDVPWAGKYNTISCGAGHHFHEGRWLYDRKYLSDYARFWFCDEGEPRRYSFPAADAILSACKVWGDISLAQSLLEPLCQNFKEWTEKNKTENGLYYQIDDRDGMEYSIGGSGNRPTINSYMYADAVAIFEIAKSLGNEALAEEYKKIAEDLGEKINSMLWNREHSFFETLSDGKSAKVRELVGYVPWYFNIPSAEKSVAWKYLKDEKYFKAPYGPTTAEQNHPDFMKQHDHECLWNGPSWPFATSQTLTALANLIANYQDPVLDESDYFDLLLTYANSHYLTHENGQKIPFIDENLDPYSGKWIARDILKSIEPPRPDADRGRDYNHSTFCDLVLSGLAGVRIDKEWLEVHPMFKEKDLSYLCADGVLFGKHSITVIWDKTGEKYKMGKGFFVMCDGKILAHAQKPCKIKLEEIKNEAFC